MSTLGWVALITTIAGVGGTGLGGVVASIFKKNSSKIVSLLLSFAGGVMLAVVCFDLLSDALGQELFGGNKIGGVFFVIAGVVFGYAVVFFLNWLIDKKTNHEVKHIDEDHPKTADDLDELIHSDHLEAHMESHSSLFIAGIVMAFAIALHNVPEGMVIGASYAADPSTIIGGSGFLIALVIGLHNIPEGMAVAVPLMSGGMKKPLAVLITALSGAPTILGALLGYWIGAMSPIGLAVSLAFASGAMLYVVFGELLPESILMWRSKLPAAAVVIGILVGIVIIYS